MSSILDFLFQFVINVNKDKNGEGESLQITDEAKELIQDYLDRKNADGLRLYKEPGGCACGGMQYALTAEEPEETDTVEIINGIQVAIAADVGPTDHLTLDRDEYEGAQGLVLLGANTGCGCA